MWALCLKGVDKSTVEAILSPSDRPGDILAAF
jgi:hypothetical protein